MKTATALRSPRVVMLGAALALLAMCSTPAQAQVQTCIATAIAPVFGTYRASGSGNTATGSISINCQVVGVTPQNIMFTVQLELSAQAQGVQRRMNAGSSFLRYNVYCDSAYSQIWADGAGSTCTRTANLQGVLGNLQTSFTVYGSIPGGQYAAPGTYIDTITVKVLY